MNILFALENFPPHVGGVETEFWEFSRNLVHLGHSVRVATSTSGGVFGQRTEEHVEIYHYPWHSFFGHPIGRANDLRKHAEWADIVQTTTYSAALPALRVAHQLGKPCILSVQEMIGSRWYSLLSNPFSASLFYSYEKFIVTRSFDAWHTISEATRRDTMAVGVPAEKITTILLGIDTTIWNDQVEPLSLTSLFGFPPNSRIFLFFGRPGKTKGADLLLDAIRLVAHKLPADVRIGFIMGDHPLGARDEFSQRLISCGISNVAKVIPSVSKAELPRYVKDAFCVIVPSRTEGFGFAAAETCQLKVPIISSDAGSLPEVVSGTHLFFRGGDSNDLATQILSAIDKRFFIKPPYNFTWGRATLQLCRLYESVLGNFATSSETRRIACNE